MRAGFLLPALAAASPSWPLALKGVLEGFGLTKDLDAMQDCLGTTETDLDEVHDAVELLNKKNAKDVLDGLNKLGSVLEKLPAAVDKCDAAAQDVKDEAPKLAKALDTLKHPKAFAFHVGKDLWVNGADIFNEVKEATDDYQEEKWEDFGKSTGEALSKLLVSTFTLEATEPQWPVVLKGVLEGVGLTKDLDLMQDCLAVTETDLEDVQDAVELLEKENAKDVLDGLSKLGSALEKLPDTVDKCDAAAQDVKDMAPKLAKALDTLKHPKAFAFHLGKDLWVNGADIFNEVKAATEDYQQAQWEDFGKNTGEALSKLLVGEVSFQDAPEPQWPVVLKGVLEGFGLTKDLDDMEDCFADTKVELDDVHDAVELLEKENAKDVLDGLSKLGSALEKLPETVDKCDASAQGVKEAAPKLAKALDAIKHPEAFAFHVGKDMVVNGADIFNEVKGATEDYKKANWEVFGKDTGEALSKLLVGETSAVDTLIV